MKMKLAVELVTRASCLCVYCM